MSDVRASESRVPDSRAHVALLVDAADLRASLSAASPTTGDEPTADATRWGAHAPADVARALVRYAGQVGRVTLARAYADWSRLGNAARDMTAARLSPVLVPATAAGEDRSHVQLAVDALQALFAGDEPEAFLLVVSDPTLLPLVQALRADGSEVTVISCAARADAELEGEADRFVALEDVLAGAAAQPAVPRERAPEPVEARPPFGGTARPAAWGDGSRGSRSARQPHPTPIHGPDIEFATYDWSPFVHLIDELEQRLPFVGVRYLVNKVLGAHNCGTEDPRLKRELMNRAVDDGLLEMFPVSNVGDRSDPVTACRLDRSNASVVAVLGESSAPPPIHEDPLRRSISPSAGGLAD
jgi:hypothetical protein